MIIERIFDITSEEISEKEFTKKQKEQYIKDQEEFVFLQSKFKAKQEARENAIKKLAEIAGLTDEEIQAII